MPDRPSKRFQSQNDRDLDGAAARQERDKISEVVAAKAREVRAARESQPVMPPAGATTATAAGEVTASAAPSAIDPERAARAEAPTPVEGTPQVLIHDEITGQYEGDDLRKERARRPTPERISRLEDKQDKHEQRFGRIEADITATRVDVGLINGKMTLVPELVELLKKQLTSKEDEIKKRDERDTFTYTETVKVQTAHQTAEIQKETAAAIEDKRAETALTIEREKAVIRDQADAKRLRRKLVMRTATNVIGTLIAGGIGLKLIQWITGWL